MQPVIHLSEAITQHISYSSLARWEEMTLLTVNYSQPISPLRCCGLFISDLALLSVAPLLVQESSASAQFEADAPAAEQQKAGRTLHFRIRVWIQCGARYKGRVTFPTFNVVIKEITHIFFSIHISEWEVVDFNSSVLLKVLLLRVSDPFRTPQEGQSVCRDPNIVAQVTVKSS